MARKLRYIMVVGSAWSRRAHRRHLQREAARLPHARSPPRALPKCVWQWLMSDQVLTIAITGLARVVAAGRSHLPRVRERWRRSAGPFTPNQRCERRLFGFFFVTTALPGSEDCKLAAWPSPEISFPGSAAARILRFSGIGWSPRCRHRPTTKRRGRWRCARSISPRLQILRGYLLFARLFSLVLIEIVSRPARQYGLAEFRWNWCCACWSSN